MMRCVGMLSAAELPQYLDHLLRLDAADRRLRFGYAISDDAIRSHVSGINGDGHRILAVSDGAGRVIGAVHIASVDAQAAELAFSIDKEWRGRGLGTQLFERAVLWARNRGIRRAHLYCLSDNAGIRQLARNAGMQMHSDGSESEGCLALAPATPFSFARELAAERWALLESVRREGRVRLPLPTPLAQVQPAV
jgi:RimJ/RimL family protein N-acetyltransferase